jgi:hypothetical protein
MKSPPSKRIFDTENALKGAFNGRTGKWQLLAYGLYVIAFAVVTGWITQLLNYNRMSQLRLFFRYPSIFLYPPCIILQIFGTGAQ